ncbi:MAG TPA: hypothetical protein VKE24_05310 [Candidatus Acidoferrales bacterium]|nr:hypothetical protein [Candidatus Acidoferrales bacterium]
MDDVMILKLTEEQRKQVRQLTGQDAAALRLAMMNGPEALLLAWRLPRKLAAGLVVGIATN